MLPLGQAPACLWVTIDMPMPVLVSMSYVQAALVHACQQLRPPLLLLPLLDLWHSLWCFWLHHTLPGRWGFWQNALSALRDFLLYALSMILALASRQHVCALPGFACECCALHAGDMCTTRQ